MANENDEQNLISGTYKDWNYTILKPFEIELKKYINECESKGKILCKGTQTNAPRFLCATVWLTVPERISEMENYALANCVNLRYLNLRGVKEIAEYGCANNPKLEIAIFDKAKTLKAHCLEKSGSLDPDNFPLSVFAENVTFVEQKAFNYTAIQGLNLPSKTLKFEIDAITKCPRLKGLYFQCATELDEYVITDNVNLTLLMVPSIKVFNENVLEDCENLKKVIVSENAVKDWFKAHPESSIEVTRATALEPERKPKRKNKSHN